MIANKQIYASILSVILVFNLNLLYAQSTDTITMLTLTELLSTTVSVASKNKEEVKNAPGIITVITKKEIESYAAENLGQVLNKIVGAKFLSVNVLTENLVVFRGQSQTPYNNHVLILLNGRPVRDPVSGGLNNSIYTGFPLQIIESIEIIRGPGSVLYGSCAYSAVININTHNQNSENYISSDIRTGSFGTFKQSYTADVSNKGINFLFNLSSSAVEGERFEFADGLAPTHDTAAANFGSTNKAFVAQIQYKDWSFEALYLDYKPYNLGGGDLNWANNPLNVLDYYKYFGNIAYKYDILKKLTIDLNTTYNEQIWFIEQMVEMRAYDLMFEVTGLYQPFKDLNLMLGGISSYNNHYGGYFIDGAGASYSLYSQMLLFPKKRISITLGAQFNKIHGLKANVSPRLAIVGNHKNGLGFKLLYSEAYRKAYPLETSFDLPVFRGNLQIKPEEIATSEAQVNFKNRTLSMAATLFYSNMSNIIYRKAYFKIDPVNNEPVFDYLQYNNGGTHDYWGTEFESKVSISKHLIFNFSHAFQYNTKNDTLINAALHPNHMIKGGVIVEKNNMNVSIFNAYFGKPHPVSSINQNVSIVNPEAQQHNLLSAKIAFKITEALHSKIQVKLSLEGTNLLKQDVRYPEYSSQGVNTLIPLNNDRGFFAGLNIQF